MSDVHVRLLAEEEWPTYRELRLAALQDSPDAFVSSYDEEVAYDEELWRARMKRSARLLAVRDDEPVGIVSVGHARDAYGAQEGVAELFGMWVVAAARGSGVAWRLVDAAAEHARDTERAHLKLWVSTDNGRAVAFYSSYGFRPADERRPMKTDETEEEVAMLLPLGEDRAFTVA